MKGKVSRLLRKEANNTVPKERMYSGMEHFEKINLDRKNAYKDLKKMFIKGDVKLKK